MSFLDNLKRVWNNLLTLDEQSGEGVRLRYMASLKDYYDGIQRPQMKVRIGQPDDNIVLNFVGLVVDRSVSLLLGKGVDFELPNEEQTPEDDYIDAVWKANRKDILLHKVAQFGAIYGTCYLKIILNGVEDRDNENRLLPRLIALDPMYVTIETDPEDIDKVLAYIIRYTITEDGQEKARKEESRVIVSESGEVVGWSIKSFISSSQSNGRWQLINESFWDYEFPPIIHWQNLPMAGSVYGQSDILNVIDLQDRINFVASNISKIIRYHAHPKTWGKGGNLGGKVNWGADEIVMLSGDSAQISNLEMQSDLLPSQSFLLSLRQALFDIGRTVDITSLADKLGALTNFGLRVLYTDALAKLGTKQQLYEEGLVEANHRLLTIGDYPDTNGGSVIWQDPLPSNTREDLEAARSKLEMGIASKQTIATETGYDWEAEQEKLQEEEAAANASGDKIGAAILRSFGNGM